MANLTLGNKTVVTQAGSAEPVLASNVNLSSATFPAGHVIGYVYGSYTYTADASVGATAEVVGPVVSLTLKNDNAKLFVTNCYGEVYSTTGIDTIRLAYKTSSFSAGEGTLSSSAGVTTATVESGTNFPLIRQNPLNTCTVSFICNVVNTANQTLYFANEVISTGTFYNNYAGGQGSDQTLTIFELSK